VISKIIKATVQTVLTRKKVAASNSALKHGKAAYKEKRFRVFIGTLLEFNDGWCIRGPDGRIHMGTGTVVRFNFRHGTWSVQRPQRCETNRLGYVFTVHHEPCWLKPERESGFSTSEFQRSYNPAFVKLCVAGQALVES
jgi:hypothetical protein